MAPIIVFIIVAGTGIVTTVLILRKNLDAARLSHHRHAMIISLGFGATAALSFFASLLAPGANVKFDMFIVIFGLIHAVVWIILMYIVTRFLLNLRRNK
jgi:hypothetical protein